MSYGFYKEKQEFFKSIVDLCLKYPNRIIPIKNIEIEAFKNYGFGRVLVMKTLNLMVLQGRLVINEKDDTILTSDVSKDFEVSK